jgi:hypothetical protein
MKIWVTFTNELNRQHLVDLVILIFWWQLVPDLI